MQPAAGTKVGRFQLTRPLESEDGRLIWLGSHDAFGTIELAAIDLPMGTDPDPARAANLRREAEVAHSLRHEGIQRVLEVGEVDGQVWIAREFVEGTTLSRLIEPLEALRQSDDALRLACIAHIIASVVDILTQTHAITNLPGLNFGVTHGQITAREILVSNRGAIKISGFGIDRRPSDGTSNLVGMGTLRSMAPELLVGTALQPPADIYATGILFHTLLEGSEPFADLGAAEIYQAIIGSKTALALRQPAPPELATLHAGLTHPDARQRITAGGALEQLRRSTVSRADAATELGKLVSRVLNPLPERDLFDQLSATSSELRAPPSAIAPVSAMPPPAASPPAATPPANVQAPPQHLPFVPPAASRPPASVHAPPHHLPTPQPSPPIAAPPTIHPSAAPPLLGMPPVAEDEGTAMIDPDMLARMREAARQASRPPAAAAQSPASSPAPAAPVAPPTIAPVSPRPAPAASSSARPARPLHDLPPGLIRNSAPSGPRPANPPAFVSPAPPSPAAARPQGPAPSSRAPSPPSQPRRPPFEIPQHVGEGTTTAMLVRRERRSLALTIVIGTIVAITLGATIAYLIIA